MASTYMDPFHYDIKARSRSQHPTKTLEVNFQSKYMEDPDPNHVKYNLEKQLFEELKQSQYIEYRRETDPTNMTTRYQAKLTVADIKHSHVVLDSNDFFIGGEVFTEAEIRKALATMFPERLI